MSTQLRPFILFALAFFTGAIPTAYLAGKLFKGLDIREHGSGNVGATNAFRVLGRKIGVFVFVLDFLKGFLPAFFLAKWMGIVNLEPGEAALWIGIGAILGHVFTPFLRFKGGKGIATGGGVLCAAFPLLFLCVVFIWTVVFLMTRLVSFSSLSSLIGLVFLSFLFRNGTSVTLLFLGVSIFIFWTHRENIRRLIQGQEQKVNR